MMTNCKKPVPGKNLTCGQQSGYYCSDDCAAAAGRAELAELGITQEMLKGALEGYYECKDMIKRRERRTTSSDLPSQSPASSDLQ